ncbi:MAG: C40 family peptidase [bacterium]|jgi:cell wall-associated NlpC family hydrolase
MLLVIHRETLRFHRALGAIRPGAIAAVGAIVLLGASPAVHAQDSRVESVFPSAIEYLAAQPSFAERAVSSAQELVMQAMGLIGIRYTFGGRTPDTGFDCSGLVRYVFNHVTGRSLPHNSFEMARMGTRVEQAELQPGDLVFFNTRGQRFSHVGIYVGDGRFIHAPSRGGRVHIVNMGDRYWVSRFNGARRLAG